MVQALKAGLVGLVGPEIHKMVEHDGEGFSKPAGAVGVTVRGVVLQIAIVDIIFSLDSVITAVGMADQLWVMVAAVVFAMLIMIAASNPLANFVAAHPTVKMLALSFLLLMGVLLVADGFGIHVPKGYIYFSLAFSVAVESLNHWVRNRRKQVLRRVRGANTICARMQTRRRVRPVRQPSESRGVNATVL